jgi:hypothetical protein
MHHVTRLIVAHIINYSNTQHSATANDKFSKPASKTAAYTYAACQTHMCTYCLAALMLDPTVHKAQ